VSLNSGRTGRVCPIVIPFPYPSSRQLPSLAIKPGRSQLQLQTRPHGGTLAHHGGPRFHPSPEQDTFRQTKRYRARTSVLRRKTQPYAGDCCRKQSPRQGKGRKCNGMKCCNTRRRHHAGLHGHLILHCVAECCEPYTSPIPRLGNRLTNKFGCEACPIGLARARAGSMKLSKTAFQFRLMD
jgi:hypothetical protein